MISFNSILKDCHTGFVVHCNLVFYLVVLNSVSFIWWWLGDWRQGRGFLCVRAILREAVKLFLTVYRLE
jgi:hypothetical protein